MKIGVVTCAELPEPDPDQEPLLAALSAAGARVELVPWDAPGASLAGFDTGLFRSCWNYHLDPERFRAWIAAAARATRLWNPEPVVSWNLHKRYLVQLEERGVPVVPTAWVTRGEAPQLEAIARERGWEAVVVKPSISAGSYQTRRFERDDPQGQAFLERLARERDVMIQRYLPAFDAADGRGERALVWIDGSFTHAVGKRARFAGQEESVSEALVPEERDLEIARPALEPLSAELLYARVDLVHDPEGRVLVSELELIEPSLFLCQAPEALERLVGATLARAAS